MLLQGGVLLGDGAEDVGDVGEDLYDVSFVDGGLLGFAVGLLGVRQLRGQ